VHQKYELRAFIPKESYSGKFWEPRDLSLVVSKLPLDLGSQILLDVICESDEDFLFHVVTVSFEITLKFKGVSDSMYNFKLLR